jgi:hypothetical protein
MAFFAIAMMWAYPVSEYKTATQPKLGAFQAIIDSINLSTSFFRFTLTMVLT